MGEIGDNAVIGGINPVSHCAGSGAESENPADTNVGVDDIRLLGDPEKDGGYADSANDRVEYIRSSFG